MMAGDWLPLRHDLADDPAVLQLAGTCSIPRQHVVGCLHAIWSWFDRHTTGGKTKEINREFIDELAGVPGFAEAMEKAGWLRVTKRGVSIPKFDRHISQSAKKRALTARRVEEHRKRKCNAASVTESLPQNRTAESEKRTVQKRTEQQRTDAAPGPSTQHGRRRKGVPALLGSVLVEQSTASAGAAVGSGNPTGTVVKIQTLLGDRGCDASLRGVVAKCADVRQVRKLATLYDRDHDKIQKPGGWWRDQLRRAGVKGI